MGIEIEGAEFILQSIKLQKINRCITVGRQNLFFDKSQMLKLFNKYHQKPKKPEINIPKSLEYADEFLLNLNIEKLDSIDFSNYENATLIHDMNYPIPQSLKNSYELVIDSGTLEHIFNFPVAIRNIIDLVKINGKIILITPTNNYCGHGFYQFSPELFFSLFQPKFGIELIRIQLLDMSSKEIYEVIDPKTIKERVEFTSTNPLTLFIEAKKISDFNDSTFPQQSDYVDAWEKNKKLVISKNNFSLINQNCKKNDLYKIAKYLKNYFSKSNKLYDSRYFKKIKS